MKRIGFIDGRRVAGWNYPATATPGNGQIVDVTDPSFGAVGSVNIQTINFRPTGIKTGINYLSAHRINVYPHGDTYTLRGQKIDFATPGRNALIHQYFAQDISIASLGPAVSVQEMCGISIGIDYAVPTLGANSAMIRLYAHAHVFPSAIRIAGEGVTNLFYFQRAVTPLLNAPVGGVNSKKLRITFGDIGDFFIPIYPS